jgi:hypothetical protein
VRGTFGHLRQTTIVPIRPCAGAKVIGIKAVGVAAEEDQVETLLLSVFVGAGAVLLVWFVVSSLDEVVAVAHSRRAPAARRKTS